jgi:ABC-2 type transport system permease protein
MFLYFFSFEARYWLRSAMVWIFFGIIALMIFGAVSTDQITVGGALSNTMRNAPYVIENYYSFIGLLTLLMTTAFVNAAASREFAYNTHQMMFSTPLRKHAYLGGRYLGAAVISLIPLLGVSAGILLAKYMPWVDAERWGPVDWQAHLKGIVVFAIPNTLFIAAVIFTIAVLSRSTIVSFVGSLLLLAGYGTAQALTSDLKNERLGALIDPFATRTFAIATKYWTVSDKNHLSLGLSGLLLWNRMIWLSVGALLFAFAYWRFSFSERGRAKRALAKEESVIRPEALPLLTAHISCGLAVQARQFGRTLRLELKRLLKSTVFIVIAFAALLNCLPNLIFNATEGFGDVSLPVTYNILNLITGTLYLFLFATVTYFAGVLIWEERDSRTDEIYDALPHPEWPLYLAKLIALLAGVAIVQLVAMLTGMAVQLAHGYHRIQPGLYIETLFGTDFTTFLFFAVLAFFIHVVSPNKYVGYFVYVVFALTNLFIWNPLRVASLMLQFGMRPNMQYSDFFGYRPYMESWTWFTLYWGAFCGLLAIASILLWQRGRDTSSRARWKNARLRFRGPLKGFTVLFAGAFVVIGGWVYYNTKILNHIRSDHDSEVIQTEYEKRYKKLEHEPAPRVLDVKYRIDLQPETSRMTLHGEETIKNETAQSLGRVRFSVADHDSYYTVIESDGLSRIANDVPEAFETYSFARPMQPGETRVLRFTVKRDPRGFPNQVNNSRITSNGTFFDSTVVPQIGYQPSLELLDRNKRRKYGLKEKVLTPALERNCTTDCLNNYISNNSDWVNVDTVISTSPGQIAIAPGSLRQEWSSGGRRYFHYQLDHYALNFYSFLSADYKVAREKWNGLNIEVYYLKEHPWNVPKMLRSVRKSFEYYTTNFGPYTQKEARIVEFPRVASFAQAFPGTMPYSESIGFIANLEHPDDIDKVFYVVGHEMGHQWWAHQVVGADMEGATVLSETLAQYSALMVMEKEYGSDAMRKFLEYEMDGYLRARGRELLKERPLLRVQPNQGYVHYNKGSIAMYYMRYMIGEEAVNRALRKIVQQYGYAQPPYPNSYALADALREQTPPELQYLITDLFYDMTLFSNRTLDATAHKRPDGRYDVSVKVEAHKFKADEQGNEKEVPVNDYIEVGALAAPDRGKKYGAVLHRERVHMVTGVSTYRFTTARAPDKVGIDPLAMLVDRLPEDNLKSVTVN